MSRLILLSGKAYQTNQQQSRQQNQQQTGVTMWMLLRTDGYEEETRLYVDRSEQAVMAQAVKKMIPYSDVCS